MKHTATGPSPHTCRPQPAHTATGAHMRAKRQRRCKPHLQQAIEHVAAPGQYVKPVADAGGAQACAAVGEQPVAVG